MALQTHVFNILPEIFDTAMNQPPRHEASPPAPSGLHQDVVAIKNLQLPFGVLAPDVWGHAREQPVLACISLLLRDHGFDDAARNDAIAPGATIHYGDLAKRVRAGSVAGMSVAGIAAMIVTAIVELATASSASSVGSSGRRAACLVARASVELRLPKAAMFGEHVTVVTSVVLDGAGRVESTRFVFSVADVKVMTLVGVHAYERTATQPIVASLSLFWDSGARDVIREGGGEGGIPGELFRLEQMLAQILQSTSFDTLESLAGFIVAELSGRLLTELLPGAHIQLRLEKPRAIAFADAPVIEVLRTIPRSKKNTSQVPE